jgi:hypothetical protein
VTEFEFCLEVVALQPIQGVLADLVVEQRFRGRASDSSAVRDNALVLLLEHRIVDVRVGDGHASVPMPENGHDRLDTRTALGELGADGVPKPVRS